MTSVAPARRSLALWTAAVAAILFFATAACSKPAPSDRLEIVTRDGAHRLFHIELAVKPEQREVGLMYRQSLAPDAGMLFDFQSEQMVSMWMKNTFIPLDMLFMANDGTIVKIEANTVPQSLETISSGKPVRAVLEIKGGEAAHQGIAVGDHVLHPIFSAPR